MPPSDMNALATTIQHLQTQVREQGAEVERLKEKIDHLEKMVDLEFKHINLIHDGRNKDFDYFEMCQDWNERQILGMRRVQGAFSRRLDFHFDTLGDLYKKLTENLNIWRIDKCGRDRRTLLPTEPVPDEDPKNS